MTLQDQYTPLKPGELLAALAIFLIPSLVLWLTIIGDKTSEWLGYLLIILFFGSLIGPLVLALVQGLPRWSPPYLGVLLMILVFYGPNWPLWGLIYTLLVRRFGVMDNWSLPVRIFSSGIHAALTWFLLLLTALILVFLLGMIPRTRALWQRIRQDWTQLSFLIFGGLVTYTILIFDEYQKDEPWQIAAFITLAIGCWLYLVAREQYQRILILLCSATLAMWILAAGKWFLVPLQNWPADLEAERPFESLRTLAAWISILAALIAPVLLNLLPQAQEPTPPEKPTTA